MDGSSNLVYDAKMTGGYNLPAKHVIHTVGPQDEHPGTLKRCYLRTLEIVKENKLKSVAFCCISTGIYGFDNEKAANVALKTVREWLDANEEFGKKVDEQEQRLAKETQAKDTGASLLKKPRDDTPLESGNAQVILAEGSLVKDRKPDMKKDSTDKTRSSPK
ncbi:O-acetyl-ADP-ribose deacetylase macrod1 [Podila clonocystis]|nr:O-acetyl-ADP-ribose deacetylase macrod1 [Podila clonocystis]